MKLKKSLTLVELLIVVVILSILGSGYLVYSKSNVEDTKQVVINVNTLNIKKQEQIDKILGKPEVKEEPKKYRVVNKFFTTFEENESYLFLRVYTENIDELYCDFTIEIANGYNSQLNKKSGLFSEIDLRKSWFTEEEIEAFKQEKIISVEKTNCLFPEDEIGVEF
ncbi:prepilin-type N-terminal cleavage/methylation domain-containing protein [Aliarcobacter butzleri]|uniref:prepilin-type N-terminal cleavage/methylation domain-containing protein n=1 Tax=Aliarcobacter butzleri TaxID=28197 RepID=UPI0021B56103|nr:prepilin-type N-terminal cleavage/methylation domain-containing protein [Aliarcobacter butzleri]MCT7587725.1 prepilin-type N-terminal cleavage/methylation domain-containing protein [Aliarcobacter butzleri]